MDKNKKTTINPYNDDDGDNKCSQYALTVAVNYQYIKKKSSKNNKN